MARSKRRPLLMAVMLAALMALRVSATPDARHLFARDDVCGGIESLAQCTQSGLPDNFCCGKTDTCLVLAGKTTVLCCPAGSTCATINPIVCDLQLQDASQNPGAAVKTTVLDGKLATCGGGCCPFGYSCDNGACKRDADQSQPPVGSTPVSSSTKTGGSTATATTKPAAPSNTLQSSGGPVTSPTGSSTATPEPSTSDADQTEQGSTPVGAIIGSVIAAILVLAALIWLFVFLRRRKNKKDELTHHDTSSSFGNIVVSAPQPIDGYPTMRQDFLAKTSAKNSMASSTLGSPFVGFTDSGGPSPKFSQPYSRRASDELSQSDARSYHHSAEIRALRNLTRNPFETPPRTPENKDRKASGGSANIDIYVEGPSPPGSSRSKTTTSTKVASDTARTTAPGAGFLGAGLGVPRQRDTTWSNILHGATGLSETPTKKKG
ncbi:uncharacterized protein B0I36DRAFT_88793 [Microdochium trichocladiopsis]|uniref:Mid2 domain-containing protein n=1 Tax=Microdochium trichocladiopsis TaxID=1682393 RepID=A0A9P9BQQ8_9PEZI|nr:uncharacterized protein B0I36DRAFT_88793 [Microdochium trichocladiopsis]KAH7035143.1 hypothetical protein B0I36DRAFT_88793 [Microdochium trichocladiopsis]